MAMQYPEVYIPESEIPPSKVPWFQHALDTYASEVNKVAAVWHQLREDQLEFKPHAKSSSVRQILTHQILSERRFFAEFIGLSEPPVDVLLPPSPAPTVAEYITRLVALARPRLPALAAGDESFWLADVLFFDVRRQRIWVFWRRLLHTAHHRAQLGVYLRLLEDKVPAVYGPTADVTWTGADPTTTLDAAGRSGS